MQRFELSRSDLEIVYLDIHDDGSTSHSIGLPDGTIIPYEDYVTPPPERPKITLDTPNQAINTPPHKVAAMNLTSTLALTLTLVAIVLVAIHAF